MKPPRCIVYEPSTRYKRVVIRSLRFDGQFLEVEVQGERFTYARLLFKGPIGFRLLDERGLCEFWDEYHTGNGWLYEVVEGGWAELEASRQSFLAPLMFPGMREFLVVCDQCLSVLATEPPEIIDVGGNPT